MDSCGIITSIKIAKDSEGLCRGFAHMEFKTSESRDTALLLDRKLRLNDELLTIRIPNSSKIVKGKKNNKKSNNGKSKHGKMQGDRNANTSGSDNNRNNTFNNSKNRGENQQVVRKAESDASNNESRKKRKHNS